MKTATLSRERKRQPRQKSFTNSYSEIFKKRKEAESVSKSKEKVLNFQIQSKMLSKSTIGEVDKSANFNTLPNHEEATYQNYINRSNFISPKSLKNKDGSLRDLSQNVNIVSLSEIMKNRILTPKMSYKFHNNDKRSKSPSYQGYRAPTPNHKHSTKNSNKNIRGNNMSRSKTPPPRTLTISKERNSPKNDKSKYNTITLGNKSPKSSMLNSSKGSIGGYLDMRHSETVEKINKMKYEKLIQETKELREHPKLSKNSINIINKLVDIKQNNVFDRLNNQKYHVS